MADARAVEKHHCHALGCRAACPPAHLMCRSCWAQVPSGLQREVYCTVKLRDPRVVDATWAPWWIAAHRAIHHVAMLREPNKEKGDAWLAKQLAIAETLARRGARAGVADVPKLPLRGLAKCRGDRRG